MHRYGILEAWFGDEGEFVILLRLIRWSYRKQAGVRNVDCRSCGMESECFTTWGKELASAYVLCPHLGTRCLHLIGIWKEGDEESNRGIIFGGIYVDYKLKNIYKVSSPLYYKRKG